MSRTNGLPLVMPAGPLLTRCAWCKTLIHDGATIDGACSHGACHSCAARLLAEFRLSAAAPELRA